MQTLFHNIEQVISVNTYGNNFKRGSELKDIEPLKNHSIITEDGIIVDILESKDVNISEYDKIIDLTNKILLPGIVECHTHTIFSGSRANEFNIRLQGISYEEISRRGGGINSTVKSVRECSFEELLSISEKKVQCFISQGVTTLEIKSGYGLSFYDEVKMLEVIRELNNKFEIDIIPTFLGAHTFPPEYINDKVKYIDLVTNEIMPFIAENELSQICDAFCETTAFSVSETERIFLKGAELGMRHKLHTDQFNSIGGLDLALSFNALSTDHLEILPESENYKLSDSDTVAVLLPGVSFSLAYQYANARNLIENNAIVALATDYNPGSSHINNISFIWGLAAFKMKMTLEEIISAYTINAAKALGLSGSIGSIEIGKNADFSVFDATDYTELLYNMTNNLNVMTIKKGNIVYEN